MCGVEENLMWRLCREEEVDADHMWIKCPAFECEEYANVTRNHLGFRRF